MHLSNEIALFISSRRSLKKALAPLLPAFAYLEMPSGLKLVLDPSDLRGPSFHMARGYRNPERTLAGYEPEQRKIVEKSVAAAGEGAVFLDVGANIGLCSFPLAKKFPSLRIFGFEPHPKNAACYSKAIRANGQKNVTLIAAAVGDTDGESRLFFDQSDSGGHSILPENLWNNKNKTGSRKVPVMRLDSFMAQYALDRLDILKIDVQGAEDAVLKGGASSLKRHLPDLLIQTQHEKVIDEGAIVEGVGEISADYRFRTMEREEWMPLGELRKISATRFSEEVLFADYFFSTRWRN